MILNDRQIAKRLGRLGGLELDPQPDAEQVQPASLDVRLGEDVQLDSGETAQPYTKGAITMPPDLGALLTGRSSIAREKVIVHKTAGWIDPGFEGKILLEMKNLGDSQWTCVKDRRVAQLVFFKLVEPAQYPYAGQYQGQGLGGEDGG